MGPFFCFLLPSSVQEVTCVCSEQCRCQLQVTVTKATYVSVKLEADQFKFRGFIFKLGSCAGPVGLPGVLLLFFAIRKNQVILTKERDSYGS